MNGNVVFCLQLRWFLFRKLSQIYIGKTLLQPTFRKCPLFFGDFAYCWTFGLCLLLNLWDSSFTYLFAAEPLNFLYCSTFEIICCCWTFEIMPWIMYLFTAEPLDFFYCWTFETMPWIMYLFDAEALRTFSSKQNHQKSGPLIKRHESEITDISIIPAKI